MRCTELICAQSVVIDKTTNQVSIFNIYENAFSTLFPFQIPILALFIQLEREGHDPLTNTFNLIIKLNNNQLLNQPVTISFIDGDVRNNTTVNMQGLVIGEPGAVSFDVEQNNEIKKTYYFKIGLKQ